MTMPDSRSPLVVDVLEGPDAVAAFDPSWDGLARLSPRATAFQSAAWHQAWLESVAAAEGQQPLVIRVARAGRPVAALALQSAVGAAGAVLRPLSAPWADYHDAVGDWEQSDAWQVLMHTVLALARDRGSALELTELVSGGLLDRALPPQYPRRQGTAVCGIDLTDAAHLEELLAVKEYQVKTRRLARLGPLSCRHSQDPGEIAQRLDGLIALHRAQWSDRSDVVAPFGAVVETGFRAMVSRMAPQGQLVFTELRVGDAVLSAYFGFRWNGWYGAYRTAYDRRFRRFSPGHLMVRGMLRDFRAAGMTYFDLTRGAYSYKTAYTNCSGHNVAVTVPPADLAARSA